MDGVWVHRPAWLIIRSEHNPKRNISFYWLERGGGWGLSPLTSLANIRSEHNPKSSISFYWLERGGKWGLSLLTSLANHQKLNIIKICAFHSLAGDRWWMGFKSINKPGLSSEIERNPKMSISFYWLERGGRWGLSSSNSLTNHQKMNITQKWAFHFIGWRGVVDGVWVHRPAQLIIRS